MEEKERERQEEERQFLERQRRMEMEDQRRQDLIGEYLQDTAARPTSKMEYALWVATMMQQGETVRYYRNYALFEKSRVRINERGAPEPISPADSIWTPRRSSDQRMVAAYGGGAYNILHYPDYVTLNRKPGYGNVNEYGDREVDHRPGHEIGHGSIYTLQFNDDGTATASCNKENSLELHADIQEVISNMTYDEYLAGIRTLRAQIEQETAVYREGELRGE